MEKAVNRQKVLLGHLRPSPVPHQTQESSVSVSPLMTYLYKPKVVLAGDSAAYHRTAAFGDDVVIVAAYRTAICKARRGGFKDTFPEDLLAPVLKALIEKTNLDPNEVGDIIVGTVLAPGSQRATECRMASFYAGFPETVPIRTVNRQCSSGLQAVADVAASIKAGFYDIESMTLDVLGKARQVNPRVESFAQARDCLLPMGITSENVAQRYGVTRQEHDEAAVSLQELFTVALSLDAVSYRVTLTT
ncbi:hypothetical protein RJ640_026653 [Escallonia rubra]|uniref:Thiolase N-terminal domain-containing protein n=1 Tax=Escallonia rubra TaxID=112253 RepID=A0AA88RBM3_9ASTE|nr:hypothetical protein RJ640_026653 [Escallonia rubra]